MAESDDLDISPTEEASMECDNIQDKEDKNNKDCTNQMHIFKSIISGSETDNQTLKSHLLEKTMQLFHKIEACNDKSALLTARQHINNAFSILDINVSKEEETPTLRNINNTKIPHNKAIEKQNRFYSTKKKRKNNKIKYAKPTFEEKIDLEQVLTERYKITDGDHSYSLQNECSSSTSEKDHHENSNESLLAASFLQHFTLQEKIPNVLTENVKIPKEALKNTLDLISDSVIELSTAKTLTAAKNYTTHDAWSAICHMLEIKKKEWACASCCQITTKENMILCDTCEQWHHWKCQELTSEPKRQQWDCRNCKSDKKNPNKGI